MSDYRVVRIPKSGGRTRRIYIASTAFDAKLREVVPYLERRLLTLDRHGANYAFSKGRNCAQHAERHVGFAFTASFDLADFFDSIGERHLRGIVSDDVLKLCLVDGAPRQGLPTSPLLSNLGFLRCDGEILRLLRPIDPSLVYTRYADDMYVSVNERRLVPDVQSSIRTAVSRFGFSLNGRKFRLQDSRNGRRVITGIAVDERRIHPTRRTGKKIRAALHQGNATSHRGLTEWAACKLPKAVGKRPTTALAA